MKKTYNKSNLNAVKVGIYSVIIYIILAVAFNFLADEQLKIRDSRGNIEMPIADSMTIEVVNGTMVEQVFTPKIQRLESINILWGTFQRQNVGTVNIDLMDTRDGTIIENERLDVSKIGDLTETKILLDEPIETVYEVPLLIRITSDSIIGSGITPMMNTKLQEEGQTLKLNGEEVSGALCFSAIGEDYIWTGLHYWEFVAVGGIILIAIVSFVIIRYKKGKHSYIVNAGIALKKYRFLMKQLVSRDFKTKYKRSILGILWSFLNPLLMMSVQYFVFSTIFESDIPNYAVYLLIGIVCFNFFSEACGMSLMSILGNANLITKVYVPKYIYPLTRVMSSVINLTISICPLIIMSLVTGVEYKKSAILALYFVVCLIIFSYGLGMLLSASMVFFRDTQFLWGVFSMLWMYATPIFYPETILPEEFKFVLDINPLYYFIQNIRVCILDGISPEPIMYVQCFLISILMLLVGAQVFRKTQDKFVLYL